MNCGGSSVASACIEASHIVNGLHVGDAIEKDVILGFKTTIGYVPEWVGEGQGLRREVEF
jgi:hypothetical protein